MSQSLWPGEIFLGEIHFQKRLAETRREEKLNKLIMDYLPEFVNIYLVIFIKITLLFFYYGYSTLTGFQKLVISLLD